MVLGVVFVWMMVRVYNSIDTVPTWYSIWTPMGFFLTMFMGGPLLGYLLLSLAGVDGWAMRLLPAISVLALVVSGVMSVMQGAELANIHSSVQQAAALVPDYGALMSWRIVLLAVALCLWIAPQLKGYQPAVPLLSVRRWLGDASAASHFCSGTGSEWRDVSDAGRRAGDYS